MPPQMHMTMTTALVLARLAAAAPGELYGRQIMSMTGLRSGTIYPILARLEGHGLVESRREMINPELEGRPARRFYRLTDTGKAEAQACAVRFSRIFTPGEG
jgi:PadR family transcriptional regulator PadR